MFKNFRDKIALSGVTVLIIGVTLLIFTFLSAYGFLTESLNIIASEDLVRTFGEALAPLIATSIRIMYLGVMGWIGSLITIRGVTIIANAPKLEAVAVAPAPIPVPQKAVAPQPKPVPQKPKAEPQKEKPPEAKPPEPKPTPEPEIVVIPPEEATQPPPQPQQPQNNNGQPQQPASS